MNNFEEAKKHAQETGEPVITATQKKKSFDFTLTQKEFLESIEKMESCNVIISVSKNRSSGPRTIVMQHVGNRLIPLKK